RRRHALHNGIRELLDPVAERTFRQQNEVEFAESVLSICDFLREPVLGRRDFELRGQTAISTGRIEIGDPAKRSIELCPGQRSQFLPRIKICDEEIQYTFVVKPVSIHAHTALRTKVAQLKAINNPSVDQVGRHALHELGEQETPIRFGTCQQVLAEIVKKLGDRLFHHASPNTLESSHLNAAMASNRMS